MLDSLQEAQQLCAMHGYETAMQAGVPVVLLLKVRCAHWHTLKGQGRRCAGHQPRIHNLTCVTAAGRVCGPSPARATQAQRDHQQHGARRPQVRAVTGGIAALWPLALSKVWARRLFAQRAPLPRACPPPAAWPSPHLGCRR